MRDLLSIGTSRGCEMIGTGIGLGLSGFRVNPPGVIPVLDLNFASLKSLVAATGPTPSFSRASTGTYFNASGVLTSAAVNEPRFDHVLENGVWVSKGLLIEEQRTNSVLQSNALATSGIWTNAAGRNTMAQSGEISPDSTANAWTGTCTTTTVNGCRLEQNVAGAAGTYTLTQFVKKGNNGFCGISIYAAGGTTDSAYYLFDLTLGIFGSPTITGYTNVSVSAKSVGSGWWRISLTITKSNAAVMVISGAITANSLTDGGCTTGQTNLFYGYQLEAGSFPTSYIPTVASSVTRSADVCQITGSAFTNLWNASEGSIVADYDIIGRVNAVGDATMIWQADDSTLNNRLTGIAYETTAIGVYKNGFFAATSGAGQANFYIADPGLNSAAKLGLAWKVNDFYGYSGGVAGTDSSGSIPTVTQLKIGSRSGDYFLCGHITRLRYFNTRLTNSQLQGLTL